MENKTKVVVCDKYKLAPGVDGYDKDLKRAIKESTGMKTLRSYIEDCNFDSKESGVYYDIDEKLSDDFAQRIGKYSGKPEIKEAKVVEAPELTEAKATYKSLYNKTAFHTWDLEKINKMIEEFKSE